ncbi:MAG: N-acetylmannosamine-6-phosphate 2-epimerase, partial [Calditrichales bacterium]
SALKEDVPVIAEGRIWEPRQARKCLDLGAFATVVGTAITRPWVVTRRFVDAIDA